MLCLGQQVRRHITGICRFICDHQNFTGSCDGINAHITKAGFFGKGNENISGPGDFIYLRDALCAKCHGCDGLCAADLVDLIHTGDMCSNQCTGIDLSVCSGRGCHDDTLHARNLCRKHVHQYAGGIRSLSTGHINAGNRDGQNLHAEDRPVRFWVKPAVSQLFFVECTDICRTFFHNLHKVCIHLLICLVDFFPGYADVGCIHFAVVKLLCIGKERLVAAFFHRFNNFRHSTFVLSVVVRASLKQILQKSFLAFCRQFDNSHRFSSFPPPWLMLPPAVYAALK